MSAFVAGFVAELLSFTSSVAIVFQAAQGFGATPAQIPSWIWALGLGMGLCSLLPSLVLRKPVVVAWSTPGAAVLATAGVAGGFFVGEAVGAFMVCSVVVVTGVLTSFPKELVVAIAGIALLSTIGNGLASSLKNETHREAALTTFLVTLSGATLMRIGSAFWVWSPAALRYLCNSMGVLPQARWVRELPLGFVLGLLT